MKTKLIYAGAFVASLIVAIEFVLVFAPHSPEVPQAPSAAQVNKDSSAVKDSIRSVESVASAPSVSNDSVTHVVFDATVLHDSLKTLKKQLEEQRQLLASLQGQPALDTVKTDSARTSGTKNLAKLLESMDAQGAAKILRNMDDDEVKQIVNYMKKRQAGKVLSSLDPERVARIMR